MGHVTRKMLLDCNGELQEAAIMMPLAAANGLLDDESMEDFIEIRTKFVHRYLKWKKKHDIIGLPHDD